MSVAPQMTTAFAQVTRLLREEGARLVSVFGSIDAAGQAFLHYILESHKEYRVFTAPADGEIQSLTPFTPAAAWYERELHDQFGINIVGHPDLRPLLFHQNWPDGVYPLAGEVGEPRLNPTKGVHLVAPGRGLSAAFLLLHPRDGRVFFVIPWMGKTGWPSNQQRG